LRLDSLPSLLTLITLLNLDSSPDATPKVHPHKPNTISEEGVGAPKSNPAKRWGRTLEVHGVRMLELTERTSSVMKVSEADEYAVQDPVVNIFRTFGQLNNVAVSGGGAVIPEGSYADTLTGKASDLSSDLVLIPWSETGSVNDGQASLLDTTENRFTSSPDNQFIINALTNATCNRHLCQQGFWWTIQGGGTDVEEDSQWTKYAKRPRYDYYHSDRRPKPPHLLPIFRWCRRPGRSSIHFAVGAKP